MKVGELRVSGLVLNTEYSIISEFALVPVSWPLLVTLICPEPAVPVN